MLGPELPAYRKLIAIRSAKASADVNNLRAGKSDWLKHRFEGSAADGLLTVALISVV